MDQILRAFHVLLGCALLQGAIVECSVSESELSTFMTSLWLADVNRLDGTSIRVNRQSHTSTGSSTDVSPANLISYVDENDYFNRPTYAALLRLLDNYSRVVGHSEYVTSTETTEINDFLTAISSTKIMQLTRDFLHRKGFVGSYLTDFEQKLKVLWFDLYPRHLHQTQVDSCAFEHVFVGETNTNDVIGLHNWIQFHLQEKAGNLNYLGYIFTKYPNVIGAHFEWYGKTKRLGSLMYGTSPEFDIAMLTTCFFARPNQKCDFSISGHPFEVQTYDITRNNVRHIATGYVN